MSPTAKRTGVESEIVPARWVDLSGVCFAFMMTQCGKGVFRIYHFGKNVVRMVVSARNQKMIRVIMFPTNASHVLAREIP
ncbi:MAG: hypothetical protein WCO04_03870 [Pseudomonadota bacterium]